VEVIVLILGVVALWWAHDALSNWRKRRAAQRAADERRLELVRIYGEPTTVRILSKTLREGDSEAVVVAMHGSPEDIHERVFKGKVANTYCYHPTGKNRYALRVKLENDIVVGWETK
jgi:hypothetical protein